MTLATDPKELMREHLLVLREYAKLVLLKGEVLMHQKERDRLWRLQEFFVIGGSLKLTQKELIRQIFCEMGGPFKGTTLQCGCPSCQAKRQKKGG